MVCLRQEQHILEELARPQTWAGTHHQYGSFPSPIRPAPPVYIYQSPQPATAAPQPSISNPSKIFQHTVRACHVTLK